MVNAIFKLANTTQAEDGLLVFASDCPLEAHAECSCHTKPVQKSSPLVIDLFSLYLLFSCYKLNMKAVAFIGFGVIFM